MKSNILLLAMMAISFLVSCNNTQESKNQVGNAPSNVSYQCPMDCEEGKTYDKPGSCPVCSMDLEKK